MSKVISQGKSLRQAIEKGKLNDGDILCLAAFGAGFTWGSALIRW